MSEFTGVIETQTIAEPPEPAKVEGCPRTVLGLLCLRGAYACLCDLVTAWQADRDGRHLVLRLHAPRGLDTEARIIQALELMPFKMRFFVGQNVVEAWLDVTRPENSDLA